MFSSKKNSNSKVNDAFPEQKNSNIKELVQLELVRELYKNFPLPLAISVLFASIIVRVFWDEQPHTVLLGWLGAYLLLSIFRGLLLHLFSRANPKVDSIKKWTYLFTTGALLSGLIWGALPWLILDASSMFNVLFIILSLFGIIAATMGTHSISPPAYFAFATPVAILLAIRLGVEGDNFQLFAYLLLLFLAAFLIFSINYYRLMEKSIRQQFEKTDLIQSLEIKKQAAETANRDKSRFIAATSHDLRQPLCALDLYLAALSRSQDAEQRHHLIAQARASSKALGELLNALLDISRLDSETVEPQICVTSLPGIIREIVEECLPIASDKGLDIRWRIPSECHVRTDPVLFQCMLRNLLSNAIRYTTEGGVLVAVRNRNGLIRVQVYDTGPGICEEYIEHIFSEFYQLANPERDRNKGLGLGLAIVRKLSHLLNHPVHVSSQPGRGSCFSIDIPVGREIRTGRKRHLPEEQEIDISGLFILVVDDDHAILDATSAWLRNMECEVLLAESRDDLFTKLKQHHYRPPDIIISDYRLRSQQTGTDLIKSVRGYFDKEIPAIIISGDTDTKIISMVNNARCFYLKKPMQESALLSLIVQAVHSEA